MRLALLLCLCWLAAPAAASAQSRGFSWGEIFDADEAVLVTGVAAGTYALYGVDSLLMVRAQDSSAVERAILDPIATNVSRIVRPGSFFLSGGAFLVGRAVGNDALGDVGLYAASALLVNEVTTRTIKGLVGRSRPDESKDPHEFRFFHGFFDTAHSSFPSGHTSAGFAAASAVQSELGRRGSSYQLPMAILLYGTASAAGLARIYDNRHWATDVLAGAAIGYLVGENVVEYGHRNDEPAAPANLSTSRAASRMPAIPIFRASIPVW